MLEANAAQVLIIYVMNPPVKDGIQGAFLVGIVITGLVFGTLSIIFPEITEGLGCLLGGFCLSMWLLVLKPGGLVTSASSKAIFISAFCVGIYALSFSHHTRPFGLIASTSFAGATAVVLGVDCFSRAGLKEFWLYIWGITSPSKPAPAEAWISEPPRSPKMVKTMLTIDCSAQRGCVPNRCRDLSTYSGTSS